MASCTKCGKPKLRKRKDGMRVCAHCGVMPGLLRWGRSGMVDEWGKITKFENGSTFTLMGAK